MTSTPELAPVPQRIELEPAQVQRLVSARFPQWADLPVTPVAHSGWDNRTFHLGPDMLVRLPSAAEYALAVDKEHRWLPVFAPLLPLPIPVPLGRGGPTADYPLPWSVYRWLPGRPASPARVGDPLAFAADLAGFLLALQAVDVTDGPAPGVHNWHRGGPLDTFDADTRAGLEELRDRLDVDAIGATWSRVLAAPWDGVQRWFHGDVAEGNLLLDDDGRLSAVIDFGTCGVGDPACDYAVAWTLLTPAGRQLFRERLALDDATWERGRGWALWKAVATCRGADDAAEFDRSAAVLTAVVEG